MRGQGDKTSEVSSGSTATVESTDDGGLNVYEINDLEDKTLRLLGPGNILA